MKNAYRRNDVSRIYILFVLFFFLFVSRGTIHSFDYWNVRRCTWRGPRSKVPGYAACHVTGSDEVRPCTRRCSRSRCCSSPACSSPALSSSSSPRCPRESNRVNAYRWWATTVLFNLPSPQRLFPPTHARPLHLFNAVSVLLPPLSLSHLCCWIRISRKESHSLAVGLKTCSVLLFFLLFLFFANFANVTRVL